MNLLLLLSALLSALTGIGGSARVPAAAAIAAKVEVAQVAGRIAVAPAARPVQALPSLAGSAAPPIARTARFSAENQPLYASRRRE